MQQFTVVNLLSRMSPNLVMAPLLGSGIISVQIRAFGLETINISNNSKYIMSLISQKDRTLAIKALEHYNSSFKDVMSENERAEANALLNWIKLEYQKNED